MQSLFSLFLNLHIIGGFTALLVFWVPIVTKKGGKVHRTAGWVYVAGMGTVSITALYMGIYRIITSDELGIVSFSWFLIFISILSGATAFYGIRVLKYKKRTAMHRNLLDLSFPLLLILSGIAIGIYGWMIQSPLITWFPLVGIFLGSTQLIYWLRKPVKKMHWWFEHLAGMLGCCIATITAFMVFGAPRLLNIETVNVFLWFLPTIFLTPVIIGYSVYYAKKFKVR
ncbi:predicted membrane protein DUF2306 [Bacillus oleivorans]|uniref:Predicted membrane protein DUF2306 n=1 Tax=Bacillus oleivorans TaxID=1448271 RepID=A0A285CSC6_9BACI|nr:DUF2306 domain-containing protein [Bacillus oleivorans]SNX70489.1 predicted membrane protein DUF2306 [Bacillus oleivorans]